MWKKNIRRLVFEPKNINKKIKVFRTTQNKYKSFEEWSNISHSELISFMLGRLYYISHPSLSDLECSINLKNIKFKDIFNHIFEKILNIGIFNHNDIVKDEQKLSIIFKNVTAFKFLNILFQDNKLHPLYPLYFKWVKGTKWMEKVTISINDNEQYIFG